MKRDMVEFHSECGLRNYRKEKGDCIPSLEGGWSIPWYCMLSEVNLQPRSSLPIHLRDAICLLYQKLISIPYKMSLNSIWKW
jgi:hypothetical protein